MRPAPLFLMDWKGDPFVTYQTHSPEETRALGARLADQLRPSDVILLLGDMGAGKSELTRGIARGLGIEGYLPSPTFPIMQMYETAACPCITSTGTGWKAPRSFTSCPWMNTCTAKASASWNGPVRRKR